MPGLIRSIDPRSQVIRLSTDAPSPNSLDPRSAQLFSLATVIPEVIGCYRAMYRAAMDEFDVQVSSAFSYSYQADNMQFARPADSIWARTRVMFDGGREVMTGSGVVYRKNGRLEVEWYVPIETGWDEILTAVDRTVSVFRRSEVGILTFRTPVTRQRGRVTAEERRGKWWRIDVACPFLSDEASTLQPGVAGTVPTFDVLHDTINSRFQTFVETPESVPVQYDNFPFTRPLDSTWIRFSVLPGESIQISSGGDGSNRFRTAGVAKAMVFVPVESGTNDSLTLVDVINAAFRAVTDTGVTFRTPSVETIGRNGKWWVTDIEIPFYADTIA